MNFDYVNVVQLLIGRGALGLYNGTTIVELALKNGNLAIIRLLVEIGAANGYICTPYNLIDQGNIEMIDYLHMAGMYYYLSRSLDYALTKKQYKIADYFLSRGATLDSFSMRTVINQNNLKSVGYCLDHGIDIHANQGEFLRYACTNNRQDVVEYLLNRGSKLSHIDCGTIIIMRGNNYEYLLNFLKGAGLDLP